ncbi:NADPH-dependent conjugated polyketone reductase [Trichinella spiralis]|uniref:NADPH-dependent conjugated polyketone reductase n=1 Tax=Trichinella spiralis TaxID=6334 RepID=A0ABR3KZ11_TRISP
MSGSNVTVEIPFPDQQFAAYCTLKIGLAFGLDLVQSGVLVQVARIAEGAVANFALQRLEAGVGPQVDFQAVLSRVEFAAVDASVPLGSFAQGRGHKFNRIFRYLAELCQLYRRLMLLLMGQMLKSLLNW